MESRRFNGRPAKPLAPYIGGKRHLADALIARIERIPHDLYAESFVGMGGVFLRRRPSTVEVINDINRDVATLFRVLQCHYVAFLDMIRWQLTTRADFERLMETDPETLTDLQRAARFLYLQRTAYGGKVAGRSFGVSPMTPARFDISRLAPLLEDVHSRLSGVVIECLPYADFIGRYDRPETLFYLDPPYFGSERDYGASVFARSDFERLAGILAAIKGRFILSLNDTPEVRAIFGCFIFEEVKTTYSIGPETHPAAELIIMDRRSAEDGRGLLL